MQIVCLLAAAVLAGAAGLEQGGENIPHPAWTLDASAEKLLGEMRASAENYRPRTKTVGLFSRAQLKYGAQRTDFIHNWYDCPLHQNSAWAVSGESGRLIHSEAWLKTAEAVRLGKMDGLAVSLLQSSRSEVIARSVSPGGEMKVLVELPYAYADKGVESHIKTAEMALSMPNAYRIDGKVVLTRYPDIRAGELDRVAEIRKALDERFGPGRFIVMFYVRAFEKRLPARPLTAADLTEAREHLRNCLRKMDGIFLAGWEIYWPRRYGAGFEREVLAPLCRSVLAEPEFAGRKYFGLDVTPGHENCYRWSYSLDSQGTRMLAERMKTVAAVRPDFIIGCEWDEQNENTCFRPMVSHGYVHQRIMRYFADRLAGRESEPFPGDETSTPNLVLSYRRSVVAGEPVEVEIRNIPDGTFKGGKFKVHFRWRDENGSTVQKFPSKTLSADEMESVWFSAPASRFVAASRFLLPELGVVMPDSSRQVFTGGFWPVDVNAVRALDTKWVKQALRERPKGVKGKIAAHALGSDGVYEIRGGFSSPVPVKSVEVLEGPDTVYMYDSAAADGGGPAVIKLEIRARGNTPRKYVLDGTIRYLNAPGLEIISRPKRNHEVLSDGWELRRVRYSNWGDILYASLPRGAVDTAEIDIDLKPLFKARLKVKDIVKKGVYGESGPAGGNLVVSHCRSQREIPPHCNVKSGAFSFTMKPKDGLSAMRLQVIDEKDRVWRSNPFSFFRPSGSTRKVHIFERDGERVGEHELDAALVPEIAYDFDAGRGSVVWSEAGLSYCGIKGGGASLVTGIGRGESAYGDSIAKYIDLKAEGAGFNAPSSVTEADGTKALEFKGCSYAMLPQQLVSKFAGFEIELDVKPDDLDGVQTLVDSGNAAYTLLLRDGKAEFLLFNTASYARMTGGQVRARGVRLEAGRWNRVKVSFDQRFLSVSVNGVEGERVAAGCAQMQSRYTAIGAANRRGEFFRGRIANLRFRSR